MPASDLLVKSGTVVSGELGVFKADVLVENGKIAGLSSDFAPRPEIRTLDATNLFVFPGFVDTHMHLGNYRPFNDDCISETRAAAAGGVTTLLTFCKVLRHRDEQGSYLDILDEVADRISALSTVDVGLHCVVGTEQHMLEASACAEFGMVSFKFYMAYRGDPQALRRGTVGLDDGKIYFGYRKVAEAGRPALAMTHCENDDICRDLVGRIRERPFSFEAWEEAHPTFGEAEAISRAARLAAAAGCPLYVVHLSCGAGLDVIKVVRTEERPPIWVEVTPHYLCLTRDECSRLPNPAIAKTAPPVRSQEESERLWEGIRDGVVDTVGTDHCAVSTPQEPGFGTGEMGFASVEIFPLLVLTGALQRDIPLETIARVTSTNAARIFCLYPRKGSIQPGADGDLAVVDLSADWVYRAAQSVSSMKFSPYDGKRIRARTHATVLRGHVVYENGTFAEERVGQPLFRSPSLQRG